MVELTRVFIFFLIQQIVIVVFSLVRAKLLAEFCGVACFGLVSQAGSLILTLQVIFGTGLCGGFIKLVAQYHKENNPQRMNQMLAAMLSYGMLVIGVGITLTALFVRPISTWVFGDEAYTHFTLICAASTAFVYLTVLFANIFSGLLQWKLYMISSIAGYVVNLVVTSALVIGFKIEGGIWALLAGQFFNAVIAIIIFKVAVQKRYQISFLGYRPDWNVVRVIFTNVGPLVAMQIVSSISLLVIRSLIIQRLGAAQNGLYQVAGGLSDTYMGLIFAILMSYVLPKITSAIGKDPELAHRTQNDGLRLSIFALSPLLILLLSLREVWIPVLYNESFLSAQHLLVWQFMGDFLLVMRRCLNVDLVPNNRWKYFVFDGLIYAGGIIVLNLLLLPVLELTAVPVSILAANLLLVLASFVYHRRRTSFRLFIENQTLLVKAILFLCAGFAASIYLPGLALRIPVIIVLLALMAVTMPRKGELAQLVHELLPAILKPREITSSPQED